MEAAIAAGRQGYFKGFEHSTMATPCRRRGGPSTTQSDDAGATSTKGKEALRLSPGQRAREEPSLTHEAASMAQYKGSIASPWDDVAIHYVLICTQIAHGRPADAFQQQCQLVSSFVRFFVENTGWTLPALFSILRDLRDLADDADGPMGEDSKMEAARVVAKTFSACLMDRTSPIEESRKWGVYYVVGLVMKCYFKVKKIALTKNILKALNNNNEIPALEDYPRGHQVTYRYYIGMLAFLDEDFAKAEKELTTAFYNCTIRSPNNQTRILAYLIPLRMLRGHLPSKELLKRFPILDDLFSPFISAIRSGHLAAFDDALTTHEARLIDLNLLLALEKARELCMRVLLRRVWLMLDKTTRVHLKFFEAGLRVSGCEVDLDEAECLVANMISKGFIRGYISHEKRMVVLAATNAFPLPSERSAPYAYV
uniref:PCI domain-containing protein n=1 Tax=Mycena chlorophos TaxID=658473 RepID=A0ABQ0M7F7_MYCCL|nr:predicted protein [Mycena chlorophos]